MLADIITITNPKPHQTSVLKRSRGDTNHQENATSKISRLQENDTLREKTDHKFPPTTKEVAHDVVSPIDLNEPASKGPKLYSLHVKISPPIYAQPSPESQPYHRAEHSQPPTTTATTTNSATADKNFPIIIVSSEAITSLINQKPKRRRKRTTEEQMEVLEKAYRYDKMPNQSLRESLAKELGMTPRRVQVWFQNKRAKERRILKSGNGSQSPQDAHEEVPEDSSPSEHVSDSFEPRGTTEPIVEDSAESKDTHDNSENPPEFILPPVSSLFDAPFAPRFPPPPLHPRHILLPQLPSKSPLPGYYY